MLHADLGCNGSVFGSRVLAATDIEDLDERIDHVIDDPDYESVNAFIAQILIHHVLVGIEQRCIVDPEDIGLIRESKYLARKLGEYLMGRIDVVHGERVVPVMLVNDRVPVPIRKVFFAMYRSSVASLGLAQAVHDKRVLDAWLSRALCEREAMPRACRLATGQERSRIGHPSGRTHGPCDDLSAAQGVAREGGCRSRAT